MRSCRKKWYEMKLLPHLASLCGYNVTVQFVMHNCIPPPKVGHVQFLSESTGWWQSHNFCHISDLKSKNNDWIVTSYSSYYFMTRVNLKNKTRFLIMIDSNFGFLFFYRATNQFVDSFSWPAIEGEKVVVTCASFAPGERHVLLGCEVKFVSGRTGHLAVALIFYQGLHAYLRYALCDNSSLMPDLFRSYCNCTFHKSSNKSETSSFTTSSLM